MLFGTTRDSRAFADGSSRASRLPLRHEVAVGLDVIDAQQIHAGIQQLAPHVLDRSALGRRDVPKSKAVTRPVSLLDSFGQPASVPLGQASHTTPPEMVFPVVADHGNEVGWDPRSRPIDVLEPAIVARSSHAFAQHQPARPIPGYDDGNRVGANLGVGVCGEHFRILAEYRTQCPVRRSRVRFDVDEEIERMFARINPAVVRPHMISQRIQVQRLKRSVRVEILFVVADQEGSINQIDIDFKADEPKGQSVPQRRLAQVIVVRMPRKDGLTRGHARGTRCNLCPGAVTTADAERQED